MLAIAAFIMGNSGNGIGLLVITVIAGSIDNIIKPYMVSSKEAGTHPIIALIGIIGAIISDWKTSQVLQCFFGLSAIFLENLELIFLRPCFYFDKHLKIKDLERKVSENFSGK